MNVNVQTVQLIIAVFSPIGGLLLAVMVGIIFLRQQRQTLIDVWRENALGYKERGDRLEKEKIDLAAAVHELTVDLEKERARSAAAVVLWDKERMGYVRTIADLTARTKDEP